MIFGASLGGHRALRSLGRDRRVIAFCDNAAEKHGGVVHGIPVVAPAQLASMGFDRVLIASAHYPEIYAQLIDLGVAADRIEILDPDVLNGADEPRMRSYWLVCAAFVVVGLALYGLFRLVAG